MISSFLTNLTEISILGLDGREVVVREVDGVTLDAINFDMSVLTTLQQRRVSVLESTLLQLAFQVGDFIQ